MRLIRLYIEENLNVNTSVFLKKNSYHYLAKVLRAKENQKIVLFDMINDENNKLEDKIALIKMSFQKFILKFLPYIFWVYY